MTVGPFTFPPSVDDDRIVISGFCSRRRAFNDDWAVDLRFLTPDDRTARAHELPRKQGVLTAGQTETAVEAHTEAPYRVDIDQYVSCRRRGEACARRMSLTAHEPALHHPRVGALRKRVANVSRDDCRRVLLLHIDERVQPPVRRDDIVIQEEQQLAIRRFVQHALTGSRNTGHVLGHIAGSSPCRDDGTSRFLRVVVHDQDGCVDPP